MGNPSTPGFEPLAERDGLRIVDRIERSRFELHTPAPVTPAPGATSGFPFPVDAASRIRTRSIGVPERTDVFVRAPDGSLVADAKNGDGTSVPTAEYVLEVGGAPMKLYLSVESPITIEPGQASVSLDFGSETTVTVGARSHHQRPAGTVTVTDDPRDAMRALSHLGSALKATSPERAFPTLRGHPPRIERGDEFGVTGGIEPLDTGVRIEVPPAHEYVYPVTSLSYYLGATVEPADTPRLVAAGTERSLDGPDGFERAVERTLKQVFFLDCLTRTEGLFAVELHERRVVEPRVDLDFAALYDRPLSEQVAAYLDVPYRAVADQVPAWKLTMDVAPTPAGVEVLPYAAADLAVVRCPTEPDPVSPAVPARSGELTSFYRGPTSRSAVAEGGVGTGPNDVVTPDPTDTLEHAWYGDGVPLGASKATVESYRHRFDRPVPADADVRVTVVCNDEEMREEGLVERLYGDRAGLDFDVTLHADLTRDELRSVVRDGGGFLHYVGHVDDRGLQCADGFLDAGSIESVGLEAFLLNACRSYEQGQLLVDRGSVAGVVTLRPVGNRGATRVGRAFARLLNRGFTLRAALSIARSESLLGNNYVVLGDGNATLVQSQSICPLLLEVEPTGSAFEVTVFAYPTSNFGGIITPNVGENRTRYLNAGVLDTFSVTERELDRYFDREVLPVRTSDGLVWSDRVDAASFRDRSSRLLH